jgi:hypothetical protein
MSWACGWCLAFNDECCEGRVTGCSHGRRCSVDQATVKRITQKARDEAMAYARQSRLEADMTGRVRKMWGSLDGSLDEVYRLSDLIKQMTAAGEQPATVGSFQRDLALEKSKARGKAELLALVMPAPLNDPDAIAREAAARRKARLAGQRHETPGMRMVAASLVDDVEPAKSWGEE